MIKQSSKIWVTATPLMILGCLLASGVPVKADPGREETCSNQTLRGNYGYAATGALIGAPGLPTEAPFQSVGITHFNGDGTLTWVEHTVVNGVPLNSGWVMATGTYTVNPNCSGSAVVNTPNSPVPLSLYFVVVKSGAEVHSIEDADSIATVFTKVE